MMKTYCVGKTTVTEALEALEILETASDLYTKCWLATQGETPSPFPFPVPSSTGSALGDLKVSLERAKKMGEALEALYCDTTSYQIPKNMPNTPANRALWQRVQDFFGCDDSE
jgi:hypothetical protein